MKRSQNVRRASMTAGLVGGLAALSLAGVAPAEAAGQITVSFSNGVLTVVGNDSANDVRVVRASNGTIQVRADSTPVRRGGTPTVSNTSEIRVSTRGGADRVRIGDGLRRTLVNGGAGDDSLVGGSGVDTIRGGDGNDQVLGGNGNDLVLGDSGADFVSGQAGNDRVQGGAGDDSLVGQAGNDILRGDLGNDHYRFDPNGAQGSDVVVEATGAGIDEIRFSTTVDVTFSLGSASTQVINPNLSIRLTGPDTFENVLGGFGNDTLTGGAGANRLNGGQGDDTLTGGAGADRIVPGEGNGQVMDDSIFADWFGHDTLTDFAAEDTVDLYTSQTVTTTLPASTVSISGPRDRGELAATGYSFTADDFS